jgi:hypothetical protein
MEEKILQDMKEILGHSVDQSEFTFLLEVLDKITGLHILDIEVKRRYDVGKILNFQDPKYFSLVPGTKTDYTLFAGGVERTPTGSYTAAMRFRSSNKELVHVSAALRFPYYRPGWTCVPIVKEARRILPLLMEEELETYFGTAVQYVLKEGFKIYLGMEGGQSNRSPMEEKLEQNLAMTRKAMAKERAKKHIRERIRNYAGNIIMVIGIIIAIYGFCNLDQGLGTLAVGVLIMFMGPQIIPKRVHDEWRRQAEARRRLMGVGDSNPQSVQVGAKDQTGMVCPRCGSTTLTAQKRGFKVGRAIVGTLAAGGLGGIVAGAAGKNKIVITCLKCGKEWRPG